MNFPVQRLNAGTPNSVNLPVRPGQVNPSAPVHFAVQRLSALTGNSVLLSIQQSGNEGGRSENLPVRNMLPVRLFVNFPVRPLSPHNDDGCLPHNDSLSLSYVCELPCTQTISLPIEPPRTLIHSRVANRKKPE